MADELPRSVAVLGASAKPERASNQAVRDYLAAGWTVWPVHPSGQTVADTPTVRELAELPGTPAIVSSYVNAGLGLELLPAILATGTGILWLNPGAESDELAAAARNAGLQVVRACNLMALRHGDPLAIAAAQQDADSDA